VKAALTEAVRSNYLVGLTISQYNPDKDTDGSAAKKLVDLLAESLPARIEAPAEAPASTPESAAADS
jgi:arginase family enzyme